VETKRWTIGLVGEDALRSLREGLAERVLRLRICFASKSKFLAQDDRGTRAPRGLKPAMFLCWDAALGGSLFHGAPAAQTTNHARWRWMLAAELGSAGRTNASVPTCVLPGADCGVEGRCGWGLGVVDSDRFESRGT